MKINLASGQRPFGEGWVNIDKIKQGDFALDILTDANDLSMFSDESADIIVAHHLVEHIAIHELQGYVREWRRVLKKGGILSVFVPNIRELDKAWLEGKINTFIHNVNTYGAWQGHIEDLHKWGYDEQELKDQLSGKDHNTGVCATEWAEIRDYNSSNPIYKNADIAQDWWILSKEFIK